MNENKVFLLSLSLSTWYQSQGRKPNSFLFFRVINSGKPSGDRVSFRSPCFFPVTFPISQYFPVSRIVARNHSPPAKFSGELSGELSGDLFFRHRPYQKERLEEISTFCEDTSTKRGATRRPRAIFGRRLHLTRRRVGAREAYSGHFRHLSRLVRRRLGLLAPRQSSPSPASPFFSLFLAFLPFRPPPTGLPLHLRGLGAASLPLQARHEPFLH